MSHNLTTAICFIAWVTLVGFLCWFFNSGWPILLLFCLGFPTDKELEYKANNKDADDL